MVDEYDALPMMDVDENYFDLNHIAAVKQYVSCDFRITPAEGIFELVGTRPPVDDGLRFLADLPFYLASKILYQKVVPPIEFGVMRQEILRADATCIALNTYNQYYYIFGSLIAGSVKGEIGHKLAGSLLLTFLQRSSWIYNLSLYVETQPQKLECIEVDLYQLGVRTATAFDNWRKSYYKFYKKRTDYSDFLRDSSLIRFL